MWQTVWSDYFHVSITANAQNKLRKPQSIADDMMTPRLVNVKSNSLAQVATDLSEVHTVCQTLHKLCIRWLC